MKEEYPKVTPKSPIGKALAYSLKREKELTLLLTDGRLEIDNNKIKNEIRPIALAGKTTCSLATTLAPDVQLCCIHSWALAERM